jgi:GT2 family glycosyltransferase
MTQKRYDIAVILINYNSSIFTKNCIESILSKTTNLLDYQIVIIDNCSEKEDYLNLESFINQLHSPKIQLIRNNINVGFGAGNMLGVHYSNAKYLAFINNDSVFLNDCLNILMEVLQNDLSIGVVGGQSYKEDETRMQAFDHFASFQKEMFGRDFLEKINSKKYPKRKAEYILPTKVNYVQGSFMLVRNEDFNSVGGFDTNIFLYYEETDLCKRLQKIDKSCYLIPNAQYIHHYGASTPNSINIKIELKISLLYVIRKYDGYFCYKILLLILQFQYFFKSFFKPKYWPLFKILLIGAPLSKSLKTKQKIVKI